MGERHKQSKAAKVARPEDDDSKLAAELQAQEEQTAMDWDYAAAIAAAQYEERPLRDKDPYDRTIKGLLDTHHHKVLKEPKTNEALIFPEDKVYMKQRKRMDDRLARLSLAEFRVDSDGNCQYSALSDQLYRTPRYHGKIREAIIRHLKLNAPLYEHFVTDASWRDYLKRMAKLKEWGDHVTLQAASNLFGVTISIVTTFEKQGILELQPLIKRSTRIVHLSLFAEIHYNSLYPAADIDAVVKERKADAKRAAKRRESASHTYSYSCSLPLDSSSSSSSADAKSGKQGSSSSSTTPPLIRSSASPSASKTGDAKKRAGSDSRKSTAKRTKDSKGKKKKKQSKESSEPSKARAKRKGRSSDADESAAGSGGTGSGSGSGGAAVNAESNDDEDASASHAKEKARTKKSSAAVRERAKSVAKALSKASKAKKSAAAGSKKVKRASKSKRKASSSGW